MRLATLIIPFLAFFLVTQAVAQERTGRPTLVQRTTLVVVDIERSIDFYQRIGLIKAADAASADTDQNGVYGEKELPLTADSRHARLVVMKGNDERAGTIGLLWYDKPQLPSARGNLAGVGSGDVIITIEVPDIQAAYTRLGQIGTRFHQTPARYTATGADGAPQSGQHMFAYDPDGHVIEITQIDAGRR